MNIEKIKLKNFRNYKEQEININKEINIFYGNNGEGKTNILEAIFLCAMGKSFRTNKDKELITFEESKSEIEIFFQKSDRKAKIKIELEENKKIYLNDIKLNKLSQLLGNLNIVLFSPDDIEILKNGPNKRRKFLNIMISQLRPNYLHTLNLYLKTLDQRNNYLKQIKIEHKKEDLLDIWDEKLAEYGYIIYEYRKEFIEKIKEKIIIIHQEITQDKEEIKIEYFSDVENKEKYIIKLKEKRKKDILRGFTKYGIHKDDFMIYINEKLVNVYGSQGQHRTAILSLKLSELEVIYDEIGEYPILLLDDFMSELDESRRQSLLKRIINNQVFITCTDKILFNTKNTEQFYIEKGKIEQ